MPGTVSPANYLWLLRSQTLEPTTATFLNQCNSQLHCKHPSLYPQIHTAPTPHPWSLIAVDKRPTEPQLVIRETSDWGGPDPTSRSATQSLTEGSRNIKEREWNNFKSHRSKMSAARQVSSIQQELHTGNRSHVATQTRPTRQREHQSTFQCRWVDRGNSRDPPLHP